MGLARGSLLLVSMPWLMAGCVVPEPEKFPEPKRGAPVIDLAKVDPPIDDIIPIPGPRLVSFNIPFKSEDAGERPVALLFLDLNTPNEQLLASNSFQLPSTFDDEDRRFNIPVPFNILCTPPSDIPKEAADLMACCHRVTLQVTHESSLTFSDAGVPKPDLIRSVNDLATVVWLAAVAQTSKEPRLLGECPTTSNP